MAQTGNARSLRHLDISLEAAKSVTPANVSSLHTCLRVRANPHPFFRGCGLEWWTALDDVARFCEFGAVRLHSLSLTSNLPNFAGVQRWLELMPSLRELTLSCDTKDDVGVDSEAGGFNARAPMAMRAPESRALDKACSLEELTLSGRSLAKPRRTLSHRALGG